MVKVVESIIVAPDPVPEIRRFTIELPEDRAVSFAAWIDTTHIWDETPFEFELEALYDALKGRSYKT